jgi:hypothetical protein
MVKKEEKELLYACKSIKNTQLKSIGSKIFKVSLSSSDPNILAGFAF